MYNTNKTRENILTNIYSKNTKYDIVPSYRTVSSIEFTTPIPVSHPRTNIFTWLYSIFYKYIYKKHRISTSNTSDPYKEEEEERKIKNTLTYLNNEVLHDKESMSKYILELSNNYKDNTELYEITKQIRNCVSLTREDIDSILQFNKSEILTIILLQNYCLQNYKEHIELL